VARRAARHRQRLTAVSRWIILRTSGGQTLPLMRSLREAGLDAWSPARTIRRVLYAGRRAERQDEIDVPILPTFVFARETQMELLAELAGAQSTAHPPFSLFRHRGRAPMIADGEIAGLREEEERAGLTMQAMRDAETFEEAEKIRIAAMKTEAARRRATKEMERAKLAKLRATPVSIAPGTVVDVAEAPAFAGVTGVVEAINGSSAVVRFGTYSWKIDGWRLSPAASHDTAFRGLAA
jgi:hypothetical protein